jgi:tetratricopeptide (TPR) repeat protein
MALLMQISGPKNRSYALLALWLIGLTSCGSDPKTYIDRGNRFFDARKYDDAALQYKKALQKNPNSGDAHYRLALVELKRANLAEAYSELQRTVDLMPENIPAIFRLGQMAMRSYNADPNHPPRLLQQAKTNAETLLGKQPLGYEGNVLQGAIDLAGRQPSDAVSHLRAALQAKPDDQDAMLGLARALVADQQTDAGYDVARQLIRKDKTFGPAYDYLFEQYAQAGKAADAENILKLKVSNNPKDAAYILELGRYYISVKRPADAAATLKKLTDNPADFPTGRLLAGDFYSSAGAPDLAVPQYEAGLSASANDKTSVKDKNIYRKRMAALLAVQRKWPEVYRQLQDCLKLSPDDQEAKLMRAVAWLDEGKPENLDPAIAELNAQIKARPQDAGLHLQLGNGLARKGDQDSARREWVAAARENRRYLPPRYALAQLDLTQGNAQDALRMSEEIVALAPRDEQALVLRANCQIAAGQFQRAESELTRLAAAFPRSARVRITMGSLALSEKKYAEAERIFGQLASAGIGAPEVLSGLTQAYLGQDEAPKALQALEDVLKRNPGSLNTRELLARAAMSSRKYDIAVDQYKQLAAAVPTSIDIQRALAAAYNAQGNATAAIGILEPAVQKAPSNVAASLDLAHVLLKAGRLADAKVQYRRMLKIQPNNANALNDLSYLMAQSGESLDEALALARKGQEVATEQNLKNSLQDTLGWIYLKKNMYDNALQSFQVAVDKNPGSMTFRYHLGTTLYQMGNKSRAKTELEAALAATPKSEDEPKIRELLARL